MSRKMTKDIKYVVEEANKLLNTPSMQNNKNEREAIFWFVNHLLLEKNMYHGFNHYIEKTLPNGEKILCHAGKETSLVQFYIV